MAKKSTEKLAHLAGGVAIAVAVILFFTYDIKLGDHYLKKGGVACPTEDELTQARGGKLLGIFSLARLMATTGCVLGEKPADLPPLVKPHSLVWKVKIAGTTMYADQTDIGEQ